MAEASPKTVKISQEHLECPICCCRFIDPKILDCLHSFCLICLDKLTSRQQPQADKITCPVCRRVTAIPDGGVASLSNCFFLTSVVDEVNKKEQIAGLGDTSVSSPCEECDEGLDAVSRCLDCDSNICQKCKEVHEQLKSTRKHRIITGERDDTQVSLTNPRIVSRQCNKHANCDICYYCETCKMLICAKCAATEHRTAEHQFSEVADAIKSFRQNVDKIFQKFEKSREEFKVVDESTKQTRNRLIIMADRACRDVSSKEEEDIAKIRHKARFLREEVTQIREDRDKKIREALDSNRDKMNQAEQIVTTVNDLMQQADDFELLDLKPKVMHNLGFPDKLRFDLVEHYLSFVEVKCHNVALETDFGHVLREEKWQLKQGFGKEGEANGEFQFMRGVACFSNGDIAVTDTSNKKLMIFTSTGRYKTTVGQNEEEGELEEPWGVAVTSDDLLLVADKDKVKVFDSHLQLISQFTPSHDNPGGHSASLLRGINVDKKKRVAVANKGRSVISLHTLNGSLIKTIPTDMVEYGLAISNKERLVFSNYTVQKLICTDFAGNEVFSVSPSLNGQSVKPVGVCCDDAGDIYVSVHYNTQGNGEIHHYDPEGVHIGRIAHNLLNPLHLAFTPRGDLVVADLYSVKIFQRV